MLRGKPTGNVGTIAIGGVSPSDRVKQGTEPRSFVRVHYVVSNSDAAENQKWRERSTGE